MIFNNMPFLNPKNLDEVAKNYEQLQEDYRRFSQSPEMKVARLKHQIENIERIIKDYEHEKSKRIIELEKMEVKYP